ncbi:hypothetical protein BDW66DRAFT_123747 [Aspergillus desertorum]
MGANGNRSSSILRVTPRLTCSLSFPMTLNSDKCIEHQSRFLVPSPSARKLAGLSAALCFQQCTVSRGYAQIQSNDMFLNAS